jgi:hypothetical protein
LAVLHTDSPTNHPVVLSCRKRHNESLQAAVTLALMDVLSYTALVLRQRRGARFFSKQEN